jgi:hypothetical protein
MAKGLEFNRHQIAVLFDRDVKTVGKHIANVLKEELRSFSVVAYFATIAAHGKLKPHHTEELLNEY